MGCGVATWGVHVLGFFTFRHRSNPRFRTVATKTHGQPQKYRVENLRIGTEVEFRVITVNILGRQSFPSDTSPTYQVVGMKSFSYEGF